MSCRLYVLVISTYFFAVSPELAAQAAAADQPLARIIVEAGQYTRIDTPVCVPLQAVSKVAGGASERAAVRGFTFRLEQVDVSDRTPVAVQIEPGETPTLWWILSGTTPAGGKRSYELVIGAPPRTSWMKAIKDDRVLLIRKDDSKVIQYNHAPVRPPEGQSPLYTRSGFIHPLWSPTGDILTNIHPSDHIHHVGIWMPWTKTKFEGKEVDFWNLKEGQGTVRFVRFLSITSGPVYGGFKAEHEHVALETDEGEKLARGQPRVVLREVWDVRLYNVGGPEKGYWLVDFKSTQRCVADSSLYQIEYHYGGIGFRGAADWEGENAAYLTSEGKTREDGHATRARWCDTSGAIEGKWAGVTHMSHPKNFRYPEPMRIWPEGQVFFNWAPSQAGDWVMEPGKDFVFRYRLHVHEGKVNVADAERVWRDFAEPPEVRLQFSRPQNATVLFDGTDFSHWKHTNGQPVKWGIVGDAMKVVPQTGSIVTKRKFRDFKLHVEFKTPQLPPSVKGEARGNSGVYLQRRYEVQILDSFGLPAKNNECGAIYKIKKPDKNVCKKPGEWQSYDIVFHSARFEREGERTSKTKDARITLWHNGVLIHDGFEIPSKTGAGQPEGPEPGPILLQDHGNEVMFRNIWIVPLD